LKQRRDQQLAIQEIREMFGSVEFDYQPSVRERKDRTLMTVEAAESGLPAPTFVDRPPPGPAWLRKYLGNDFFANVVAVKLPYFRENNVGLKILNEFSDLTRLQIGPTRDLDNEMAHVESLGNLEILHMSYSNVTDRGLSHIARLPKLRILSLNNTLVTDAGLQQLSPLRKLEHLELKNTSVTGAGTDALRRELPDCAIVR
jgi:hypothetical protein